MSTAFEHIPHRRAIIDRRALADRLAEKFASPVVHLDDIFWLPGGFNEKRDPDEVANLVKAARLEPD